MWRSIPVLLALGTFVAASSCSSSGAPWAIPTGCKTHWIEPPPGVELGKPLSRPIPPDPGVGPNYGYACIEVTVTVEGQLVDPEVVATNSDAFASAFLETLARWRYEPSTRDGEPVELRVLVSAAYQRQR